ncbi:MAG: hypothetical protein GX167_07395 [Firmicutes bacterium]|nr:hypothetical protein [Bacillota bacterium]
MKKAKEVAGLPVIDITTGSLLGNVQELIIDHRTRKVAAVVVGERAFLKARTEIIPYTDVRTIGHDAMMIAGGEAAEDPRFETMREHGVTGKQLITADGTLAGSVTDYAFQPADGQLAELYVISEKQRKSFAVPVAVVENFGRDFIILRNDYQTQVRPLNTAGEHTPRRLVRTLETRAVEFALGRPAGSTVTDDEGAIIIRKGQTVTREHVEMARRRGKLAQLLLAAGAGEIWESMLDVKDILTHLQDKVNAGGQVLEQATREKMRAYVLGKKLAQAVHAPDGTLLGARGDIVTENMRERAEAAGRLSQLFLAAVAADVQAALDPVKKQLREIFSKKEL